jgi:hypothetical protein
VSKAKPKAKSTSRESKSVKPATASTSLPKAAATGEPASRLIDQRIGDLGGWRGETLARMRALILEADSEMTEDCKWIKPTNPLGVPVWSHHGIVCTGETYTNVVKLTFAQGSEHPRPIAALQLQPGRQRATGNRHPRRGEGRRPRVQGAREGRGGRKRPTGKEASALDIIQHGESRPTNPASE